MTDARELTSNSCRLEDRITTSVQRLRAVEGELRPTTNRTTQAKVMISQYSEDWHKWADEIAAVADSLEGK